MAYKDPEEKREKRAEYYRKWYAEHREQVRERNLKNALKSRAEHPERNRENCRKWHAKHLEQERERIRESMRKWRAEHPEQALERERKWRAEHPETVRKAIAKWVAANPEKEWARQQRRRARKLGLEEHFTPEEWAVVLERYGGACLACGRKPPEVVITVDHVIPLARGGTDTVENLQPLCVSCNSRKWAKVIDYRPQARAESETQP